MVAWTNRPQMTVTVYIPNWLPMAVMSSISTILPAIRNRMPIGAYLRIREAQRWYGSVILPLWSTHPGTYHMIIVTSLMIASLRQSKKSLRGCPCSLMLPMIKPKQRENTTRPSALTPLTDPGTGTVSSRVIAWLPLSVNIVSFTVILTWTILLPYWVLYYVFQNKKMDSNIRAVNNIILFVIFALPADLISMSVKPEACICVNI